MHIYYYPIRLLTTSAGLKLGNVPWASHGVTCGPIASFLPQDTLVFLHEAMREWLLVRARRAGFRQAVPTRAASRRLKEPSRPMRTRATARCLKEPSRPTPTPTARRSRAVLHCRPLYGGSSRRAAGT
jgi:hypothetical protein